MKDELLPPIAAPIATDAAWPDGLTVRARSPSDAAGIADLHNLPGYRSGTLRTPYHSVEEILRGIESQPDKVTALVALLDGRIVGDIGMTRLAGRRAHTANFGMGVHDGYTGRGIGKALLGEVIAIADQWYDLQRLEMTVYVDNEPALALYRRFGFEVEGTLRRFAFRAGAYVDAYTMARLKGRGSPSAGHQGLSGSTEPERRPSESGMRDQFQAS